jgi:hypothetical protein
MKKKMRLSDIHLSQKEKIHLLNEAIHPKEKKKISLSKINKEIKKNDFHIVQQPYEMNEHFKIRQLFFKLNPPKSINEFHIINSLSFILVNIIFFQVRYASIYEDSLKKYLQKDKSLKELVNQTSKKLNVNFTF